MKINAIKKRLLHRVGKAIADYQMIEDGDRIMVCVSGGKDSFTMFDLLHDLQARAPVGFELVAVCLNQGEPGFPEQSIVEYFERSAQRFLMLEKNIYKIVRSKIASGETKCAMCSRLRRGILYNEAVKLKCSKIALGHHADDIIETFLLNFFFNGTLKAMPPVLKTDDGRNTVIRPLCYCMESDIVRFADLMSYPSITCGTCGSQPNLQRKRIKKLIAELSVEIPSLRQNMLAALGRVVPSHLLDRKLKHSLCGN